MYFVIVKLRIIIDFIQSVALNNKIVIHLCVYNIIGYLLNACLSLHSKNNFMEYLHNIHSILRWLVILTAIYAIFKAFMGMQQQSSFTKSDNTAGVMFTSVIDLQLLIGLILYFTSGLGYKNIQANGMGFVMKDGFTRFFAVEHIAMMLIAIIIIHIGRSKSKKANSDLGKHKAAFWYYLIGLILILASIPWPFRKGFEAMGWM
ncbi:MAG: hypothetical protein IPL09_02085 [Bacteroidetes bacterium]|jgi:uncharacterized membrane protein YphA (DoxX/SURF4 family)|nr:hypothetical protein [Bacteroidota bacterium]MBK6818324.1 hypothetical protein [Bacteroidota bacterium]MBK7040462.1 hypothetical protein [Bacteroidota bacterium]MBK7587199.1 hypothetical protein [Bacteroidota bacterium]MBK8328276.1 hypothetical protein [Bacteroidota bacterium]